MKFNLLMMFLFANSIQATSAVPAEPERPNNGILIFLDDSEDSLRAISSDLMSAIAEEAGPIIASASLLVNIRGDGVDPHLKDPAVVADIYLNLKQIVQLAEQRYAAQPTMELLNQSTKAQEELDAFVKKAVVGLGAFDAKAAQRWVVKEVDRNLYLLLPKRILFPNTDSVNIFSPEARITAIEQKLGLKVNHLATKDVAAIKKPTPAPRYASYFVDLLPRIFVTSGEYPLANKNQIPSWSIYLTGHGYEGVVADLKLNQFQDFLSFLEIMIPTRIVVYNSCFAAGVNTELMYADSEKGATKTYSFPIITQALTDAPTSVPLPGLRFEQRFDNGPWLASLIPNIHYGRFLSRVTRPGVLNYNDIMAPLVTSAGKAQTLKNLPQIKLPGLPWFSVLDSGNKTVAIGSVLAKTRTAPLNIGTFFKKGGRLAEPLGILLYASDVPFELIINTKQMPLIVSMVPGDAVHHIKRITSTTQGASAILNSFNLEMQGPEKIFFIDSIQATSGLLTNVVIDINMKEFRTYFVQNGILYRKAGIPASPNDSKTYQALLRRYGKAFEQPAKEQAERKTIERKTVQETLTPAALARIQNALKARGKPAKEEKIKEEKIREEKTASRRQEIISGLMDLLNAAEESKVREDYIRILKHVLSLLLEEQNYTASMLSLVTELLGEINGKTKIVYLKEHGTDINYLLVPILKNINKEIKRLSD